MSSERKIVKCRGCGADIFFAHGVPFYAKKVPVLVQTAAINMESCGSIPAEEYKVMGYVSHFINCPYANQFSKGNSDGKPI